MARRWHKYDVRGPVAKASTASVYTDGHTFPGCDITGDDLEFGKAMDRFKRENRKPFPTCSEVLAVVKSLGYRKFSTTIPVGD